MFQAVFVSLLQAVAGDPTPPPTEPPAAAVEAAPPAHGTAAPTMRRVCTESQATGRRLPTRRCRMVEVPAAEEPAPAPSTTEGGRQTTLPLPSPDPSNPH